MKAVIITGASKGLGLEIKKQLEKKRKWINGGCGEPLYQVTDFSRSSGVDLTKTIPAFKCDILILNAGSWKNDWKLNFEVPLAMAEQVDKKTLVIFILSNAAYRSYGNDHYSAAKAGLLYYARRKQQEGYRFFTVSPGTIADTNFWDNAPSDHRLKGAIPVETVAKSVIHIIEQAEQGAFITELISMPFKKEVK